MLLPCPHDVGFALRCLPRGTGFTDIASVLDAVGRRAMSRGHDHCMPRPGGFAAPQRVALDWTSRSVERLSPVLDGTGGGTSR